MRTRSTRATFDDLQRPGKARCNDSVVGRIFVLVTKCGMLIMVDRAWFWRLPHVPSQAMLRDWPVNLMRWRNPLNCPTVDHTVPTLSTVYSIRIWCEPVRPEPSSIWEPLRSWSNISNCYKHNVGPTVGSIVSYKRLAPMDQSQTVPCGRVFGDLMAHLKAFSCEPSRNPLISSFGLGWTAFDRECPVRAPGLRE